MAERHTRTQRPENDSDSVGPVFRVRHLAFGIGTNAVHPSRQAAPGRVCPCGRRLSRYNLSTLCYCCEHQAFDNFYKEY